MIDLYLRANCSIKYVFNNWIISHCVHTVVVQALLSVFRGRQVDGRAGDASIERCEMSLEDSAETSQCRLIVKMICKHGVKQTYKLTYEAVEVRHAVFNKATAKNHWSMGAHVLRSFSEYFGTNTEQLDMYYEASRFTFTSYTEKVMNGNEILRKALQTSITVDNFDFEDLSVEEKVHIAISVKDFKNIVTHAETLKATIAASYSIPSKPMQLSYTEHGVQCEFVLMTIGESRARSVTPSSSLARNAPSRASSRQQSARPALEDTVVRNSTEMPPPVQPASRSFREEPRTQQQSRQSPQPPPASVPHESLFIPMDNDDTVWGEKSYEEEEDQLGWGDSADKDSFTTSLHRSSRSGMVIPRFSTDASLDEHERRVPPTQRISEISGLFDD